MMDKSQQVIDPLPPEVQECIDAYGRYYAEQHKLGMSVRDDMKYVASVAIRSVAVPECGSSPRVGEDEDDFILRVAREVGMDPKPFVYTKWKDGIDIECVIERMKAFVRAIRTTPVSASGSRVAALEAQDKMLGELRIKYKADPNETFSEFFERIVRSTSGPCVEALKDFIAIEDEGGGLLTTGDSASDLVLAIDAARKALSAIGKPSDAG